MSFLLHRSRGTRPKLRRAIGKQRPERALPQIERGRFAGHAADFHGLLEIIEMQAALDGIHERVADQQEVGVGRIGELLDGREIDFRDRKSVV